MINRSYIPATLVKITPCECQTVCDECNIKELALSSILYHYEAIESALLSMESALQEQREDLINIIRLATNDYTSLLNSNTLRLTSFFSKTFLLMKYLFIKMMF